MAKLQNILKIYSGVFMLFGLVSAAYSVFSEIVKLLNENVILDKVAAVSVMSHINGGLFLIIGGLLQIISGLVGFRSAKQLDRLFPPIVLSVVTISWQIAGFIILFTQRHINIRLAIQLLMTFFYLALLFTIRFKSTVGLKKKHLDLNPAAAILSGSEQLSKKRDVASLFKVNYRQKHVNIPIINLGGKRKRVNIKPRRRIKR